MFAIIQHAYLPDVEENRIGAMQERTRLAIEAHIERIIEATSYENFKKIVPEACPCNRPGSKLCHQVPAGQLNCLFCYCPEYKHELEEGGCRIRSEKGKWFFNEVLARGKVWDCSDCDYPQRPEVVRNYLRKVFKEHPTT